MRCHHFDAGRCRSCSLLDIPTVSRLEAAEAELASALEFALGGASASEVFGPRIEGPDAGFRNTAKMVVSGTTMEPVLGILDAERAGVDLRDCPLYPPAVHRVLDIVPSLVRAAQIPPYRVEVRRGELKHVLVTVGDDDRLMVRFVLASVKALGRLEEKLPLLEAVPEVASVSANINPEHTSIIEGPEEIHVWGEETLPVTQGAVTLLAGPRSFLQTNSPVASGLYLQAQEWVAETANAHGADQLHLWDLYCGIGGFALHAALASPTTVVTGVEVAPDAADRAGASAAHAGVSDRCTFVTADATAWAAEQAERPDLVIVNPPRRGLGPDLAAWLQESGPDAVIYSSCNPATLAADLAAMPAYTLKRAHVADMFPHTAHLEVLTLLGRED
ncbi:23S rRNA methyltransferase [Brevibacterium ravenspurgense]|uniref:23S rRNA methyltransferase n=1 Tax=Brevibacterium ravenspurgense TaxID=479117 RepID=A0A2I1IGT2_9MICO|nr:methyltransferase domain-containing protein [Brevibacterium ravenspurgense]PKY70325.1 23S rRNA methyltransferase [Brevibacterium ravenspurgense]